jgi:GntR family transcriptional repressor for pyruvate dehydrogenase complex
MSATRRPLTREALADRLAERILDGQYPAGAKLPSERELAAESGLSRPIVREVLQGLSSRGLVDIQHGRGTFARDLRGGSLVHGVDTLARARTATARDLVEARSVLERQTAERAATRATAEDVAALRELADAFDRAENVIDRARCDLAFHAMVAKAARNPVLVTMFTAIAPYVVELQIRSVGDPAIVGAGAPLHHVVVDRLAAGDAEGAGAAMWEHITLATQLFGEDLDRSLDSVARRNLQTLLGDRVTLDEVIADVLDAR